MRNKRFDVFTSFMAPDGAPWIGFVQPCLNGMPVAGNPNCDQAAGGPNDSVFGFVGRLVRVHEKQTKRARTSDTVSR